MSTYSAAQKYEFPLYFMKKYTLFKPYFQKISFYQTRVQPFSAKFTTAHLFSGITAGLPVTNL
jgi:hypothetical protein